MNSNTSAVILAAGLGTRMKSKRAKVLHQAGGLCLIEHVVRAALGCVEPQRIVAVVGHQAEQVRHAVAQYGIQFRLQAEQLGTGHALLVCDGVPELAEGQLLVLYGDCPLLSGRTLERLLDEHARGGAAVTVMTTELDNPTGYGRIIRGPDGRVAAIVEQRAANEEQLAVREINSGIYCMEAAKVWPLLRRLQPNPASGEIYLTDVVELLNEAGERVLPFLVEDSHELLGINTRVELAAVDRILRTRKVHELMLNGVTVLQPESCVVDADVHVGPDSMIGPFAQLLGRTVLGERCEVGACSILRDTQLEDGAQVLPFTFIDKSKLASEAQVGPYARLRPEVEIGPNARVGNFVELKKSKLGPGAKANHLAYLGDATIGAKVNIGAGTITCNYDGEQKYPTTIGERAFIGSNATLVAPVDIEPGSYIAAGSVITDRVPADSLALGRARQVIKEGWAAKRRTNKPSKSS